MSDDTELVSPDAEEIGIECPFHDELTVHLYPGDWIFGGANGLHPGADPRWKPTTYTYFGEDLSIVHVTQTPLCDGEAIEHFHRVRAYGPSFHPMYLQAERPDKRVEAVRVRYDWRSGTIHHMPEAGGSE